MRRFGHWPVQAVALHCSLANGGAWAPVAARLGEQMTLFAPDLPGHGDTPDWVGGQDYLAAALETLGSLPEGPLHVLGHSFGAVVALEHAMRAPDRVLSLTLIEPVSFAGANSDAARAAAAEARRVHAEFFEQGDREGAARVFTDIWGTGVPWSMLPCAVRERVASQIHVVTDQMPILHDDRGGLLGPGRLEAVPVPVLLIDGAESPPIVSEIMETLLARLPKAQRVTIGGAAHMAPLTHPGEVGATISEFIGALVATDSPG